MITFDHKGEEVVQEVLKSDHKILEQPPILKRFPHKQNSPINLFIFKPALDDVIVECSLSRVIPAQSILIRSLIGFVFG